MKCPKCGDPIKVSHTYIAGKVAKTQRASCDSCRAVYCMVTFLEEVTKSGQGAYAKAQRIARKQQ